MGLLEARATEPARCWSGSRWGTEARQTTRRPAQVEVAFRMKPRRC